MNGTTLGGLFIVAGGVLNVVVSILTARRVRRARKLVEEAIERQRGLLLCAGMVAFIASDASGAPSALRRECRKILPPDLEIVIHDVSGSIH